MNLQTSQQMWHDQNLNSLSDNDNFHPHLQVLSFNAFESEFWLRELDEVRAVHWADWRLVIESRQSCKCFIISASTPLLHLTAENTFTSPSHLNAMLCSSSDCSSYPLLFVCCYKLPDTPLPASVTNNDDLMTPLPSPSVTSASKYCIVTLEMPRWRQNIGAMSRTLTLVSSSHLKTVNLISIVKMFLWNSQIRQKPPGIWICYFSRKSVNISECREFVHVTHCQYPSLGLWGKRSFNCPLWVCLNILVWRYNARVLEPSQVVYCETDRMCIIMAQFEYFWFKYVLIVCWIDNESSLKY